MKRIKQSISFLFNPYSPIVTLVLGFLINIITSTDGVNRPRLIQKLYMAENVNKIIFGLFLWLLFSFYYTANQTKFKQYESEVVKLQESLLNKERQIEQNSGVILNKYGELARFNKKQRFYDLLKSFVDGNSMVQNAQLYKYSSKIEKNNLVKIKLSFEEGYTYEGVNTNCILQSYFEIKLKQFTDISKVIDLWKLVSDIDGNSSDVHDECILNEFLNKFSRLLKEIINELNGLSSFEYCEEYHYCLYRTALLLLNIIRSDSGIETVQLLNNEEIEEYLLNTKRTGILGTILLKDTYIFKHLGVSSKNGRLYVSFYFKLYKEDYILLVSIPPNELNNDIKWEKEVQRLKNDFISRLTSTNA